MNIDTGKFALALGLSAALLWIGCSILVWLLPGMMLSMTGAMLHADLSALTWHMSLGGVLAGLVFWSALSALFGAFIAAIYNLLAHRGSQG